MQLITQFQAPWVPQVFPPARTLFSTEDHHVHGNLKQRGLQLWTLQSYRPELNFDPATS